MDDISFSGVSGIGQAVAESNYGRTVTFQIVAANPPVERVGVRLGGPGSQWHLVSVPQAKPMTLERGASIYPARATELAFASELMILRGKEDEAEYVSFDVVSQDAVVGNADPMRLVARVRRGSVPADEPPFSLDLYWAVGDYIPPHNVYGLPKAAGDEEDEEGGDGGDESSSNNAVPDDGDDADDAPSGQISEDSDDRAAAPEAAAAAAATPSAHSTDEDEDSGEVYFHTSPSRPPPLGGAEKDPSAEPDSGNGAEPESEPPQQQQQPSEHHSIGNIDELVDDDGDDDDGTIDDTSTDITSDSHAISHDEPGDHQQHPKGDERRDSDSNNDDGAAAAPPPEPPRQEDETALPHSQPELGAAAASERNDDATPAESESGGAAPGTIADTASPSSGLHSPRPQTGGSEARPSTVSLMGSGPGVGGDMRVEVHAAEEDGDSPPSTPRLRRSNTEGSSHSIQSTHSSRRARPTNRRRSTVQMTQIPDPSEGFAQPKEEAAPTQSEQDPRARPQRPQSSSTPGQRTETASGSFEHPPVEFSNIESNQPTARDADNATPPSPILSDDDDAVSARKTPLPAGASEADAPFAPTPTHQQQRGEEAPAAATVPSPAPQRAPHPPPMDERPFTSGGGGRRPSAQAAAADSPNSGSLGRRRSSQGRNGSVSAAANVPSPENLFHGVAPDARLLFVEVTSLRSTRPGTDGARVVASTLAWAASTTMAENAILEGRVLSSSLTANSVMGLYATRPATRRCAAARAQLSAPYLLPSTLDSAKAEDGADAAGGDAADAARGPAGSTLSVVCALREHYASTSGGSDRPDGVSTTELWQASRRLTVPTTQECLAHQQRELAGSSDAAEGAGGDGHLHSAWHTTVLEFKGDGGDVLTTRWTCCTVGAYRDAVLNLRSRLASEGPVALELTVLPPQDAADDTQQSAAVVAVDVVTPPPVNPSVLTKRNTSASAPLTGGGQLVQARHPADGVTQPLVFPLPQPYFVLTVADPDRPETATSVPMWFGGVNQYASRAITLSGDDGEGADGSARSPSSVTVRYRFVNAASAPPTIADATAPPIPGSDDGGSDEGASGAAPNPYELSLSITAAAAASFYRTASAVLPSTASPSASPSAFRLVAVDLSSGRAIAASHPLPATNRLQSTTLGNTTNNASNTSAVSNAAAAAPTVAAAEDEVVLTINRMFIHPNSSGGGSSSGGARGGAADATNTSAVSATSGTAATTPGVLGGAGDANFRLRLLAIPFASAAEASSFDCRDLSARNGDALGIAAPPLEGTVLFDLKKLIARADAAPAADPRVPLHVVAFLNGSNNGGAGFDISSDASTGVSGSTSNTSSECLQLSLRGGLRKVRVQADSSYFLLESIGVRPAAGAPGSASASGTQRPPLPAVLARAWFSRSRQTEDDIRAHMTQIRREAVARNKKLAKDKSALSQHVREALLHEWWCGATEAAGATPTGAAGDDACSPVIRLGENAPTVHAKALLATSLHNLRLCIAVVPASSSSSSPLPLDESSGSAQRQQQSKQLSSIADTSAVGAEPGDVRAFEVLRSRLVRLRQKIYHDARGGSGDGQDSEEAEAAALAAAVARWDEQTAMSVDNYIEIDLAASLCGAYDGESRRRDRPFDGTVAGVVRINAATLLEVRGTWIHAPRRLPAVPDTYAPSPRLWALRGTFVQREAVADGGATLRVPPRSSACLLEAHSLPLDYIDPSPDTLQDTLPGVPVENFMRRKRQDPGTVPFIEFVGHSGADSGSSSNTANATAQEGAGEEEEHPLQSFLRDYCQYAYPSKKLTQIVFLFGDAYTTRTYADVLLPGGRRCLANAVFDSLPRSGTVQVDRGAWQRHFPASSHERYPPVLHWFHGGLGVAAAEEEQRRAQGEAQWRATLNERELGVECRPGPLAVAAMTQQPLRAAPRIRFHSLTHCGPEGLLVFGGLDDAAAPSQRACFFWMNEQTWSPFRLVLSEEARQELSRSPMTPDVVAALLPAPRHGHTAVFRPADGSVYLYGGVGYGGVSPLARGGGSGGAPDLAAASSAAEYASSDPLVSGLYRESGGRRPLGYLSDIWRIGLEDGIATPLRVRKTVEEGPEESEPEPPSSDSDSVDETDESDYSDYSDYSDDSSDSSADRRRERARERRREAAARKAEQKRKKKAAKQRARRVSVSAQLPPPVPLARWRHVSVVHDDYMIVLGGKAMFSTGGAHAKKAHKAKHGKGSAAAASPASSPSEMLCDCGTLLFFDFRELAWEVRSSYGAAVPGPRYGHAAALHENNLYVYGGRGVQEGGSGRGEGVLGDFYKLDLITRMWDSIQTNGTVRPPALELASMECATVGGTGCLFLVGGLSQPLEAQLPVYMFSTATYFWRAISVDCGPVAPRLGHTIGALVNALQESAKEKARRRREKRGLPQRYDDVQAQLLLVGGEEGPFTDEEASVAPAFNAVGVVHPRHAAPSCVIQLAEPATNNTAAAAPRKQRKAPAASAATTHNNISLSGSLPARPATAGATPRPPSASSALLRPSRPGTAGTPTGRSRSRSARPTSVPPPARGRSRSPAARRRLHSGDDGLMEPYAPPPRMTRAQVSRSVTRLTQPRRPAPKLSAPAAAAAGSNNNGNNVISCYATLTPAQQQRQVSRLYYQDLQVRAIHREVLAKKVRRERRAASRPAALYDYSGTAGANDTTAKRGRSTSPRGKRPATAAAAGTAANEAGDPTAAAALPERAESEPSLADVASQRTLSTPAVSSAEASRASSPEPSGEPTPEDSDFESVEGDSGSDSDSDSGSGSDNSPSEEEMTEKTEKVVEEAEEEDTAAAAADGDSDAPAPAAGDDEVPPPLPDPVPAPIDGSDSEAEAPALAQEEKHEEEAEAAVKEEADKTEEARSAPSTPQDPDFESGSSESEDDEEDMSDADSNISGESAAEAKSASAPPSEPEDDVTAPAAPATEEKASSDGEEAAEEEAKTAEEESKESIHEDEEEEAVANRARGGIDIGSQEEVVAEEEAHETPASEHSTELSAVDHSEAQDSGAVTPKEAEAAAEEEQQEEEEPKAPSEHVSSAAQTPKEEPSSPVKSEEASDEKVEDAATPPIKSESEPESDVDVEDDAVESEPKPSDGESAHSSKPANSASASVVSSVKDSEVQDEIKSESSVKSSAKSSSASKVASSPAESDIEDSDKDSDIKDEVESDEPKPESASSRAAPSSGSRNSTRKSSDAEVEHGSDAERAVADDVPSEPKSAASEAKSAASSDSGVKDEVASAASSSKPPSSSSSSSSPAPSSSAASAAASSPAKPSTAASSRKSSAPATPKSSPSDKKDSDDDDSGGDASSSEKQSAKDAVSTKSDASAAVKDETPLPKSSEDDSDSDKESSADASEHDSPAAAAAAANSDSASDRQDSNDDDGEEKEQAEKEVVASDKGSSVEDGDAQNHAASQHSEPTTPPETQELAANKDEEGAPLNSMVPPDESETETEHVAAAAAAPAATARELSMNGSDQKDSDKDDDDVHDDAAEVPEEKPENAAEEAPADVKESDDDAAESTEHREEADLSDITESDDAVAAVAPTEEERKSVEAEDHPQDEEKKEENSQVEHEHSDAPDADARIPSASTSIHLSGSDYDDVPRYTRGAEASAGGFVEKDRSVAVDVPSETASESGKDEAAPADVSGEAAPAPAKTEEEEEAEEKEEKQSEDGAAPAEADAAADADAASSPETSSTVSPSTSSSEEEAAELNGDVTPRAAEEEEKESSEATPAPQKPPLDLHRPLLPPVSSAATSVGTPGELRQENSEMRYNYFIAPQARLASLTGAPESDTGSPGLNDESGYADDDDGDEEEMMDESASAAPSAAVNASSPDSAAAVAVKPRATADNDDGDNDVLVGVPRAALHPDEAGDDHPALSATEKRETAPAHADGSDKDEHRDDTSDDGTISESEITRDDDGKSSDNQIPPSDAPPAHAEGAEKPSTDDKDADDEFVDMPRVPLYPGEFDDAPATAVEPRAPVGIPRPPAEDKEEEEEKSSSAASSSTEEISSDSDSDSDAEAEAEGHPTEGSPVAAPAATDAAAVDVSPSATDNDAAARDITSPLPLEGSRQSLGVPPVPETAAPAPAVTSESAVSNPEAPKAPSESASETATATTSSDDDDEYTTAETSGDEGDGDHAANSANKETEEAPMPAVEESKETEAAEAPGAAARELDTAADDAAAAVAPTAPEVISSSAASDSDGDGDGSDEGSEAPDAADSPNKELSAPASVPQSAEVPAAAEEKEEVVFAVPHAYPTEAETADAVPSVPAKDEEREELQAADHTEESSGSESDGDASSSTEDAEDDGAAAAAQNEQSVPAPPATAETQDATPPLAEVAEEREAASDGAAADDNITAAEDRKPEAEAQPSAPATLFDVPNAYPVESEDDAATTPSERPSGAGEEEESEKELGSSVDAHAPAPPPPAPRHNDDNNATREEKSDGEAEAVPPPAAKEDAEASPAAEEREKASDEESDDDDDEWETTTTDISSSSAADTAKKTEEANNKAPATPPSDEATPAPPPAPQEGSEEEEEEEQQQQQQSADKQFEELDENDFDF